jgi:chromate transporter
MVNDDPLWSVVGPLFARFVVLSLMAVGGGVIMVAPEMQRYVVDSQHWITGAQFSAAYAIAQAAPGPNMLFATLVGWQVAGWLGAAAATVAILAPPTLLALAALRMPGVRAGSRLGRAIAKGLVPISVGFVLATGFVLLRGTSADWRTVALTLAAAFLAFRTKINPVWLIVAGGALAGAGVA